MSAFSPNYIARMPTPADLEFIRRHSSTTYLCPTSAAIRYFAMSLRQREGKLFGATAWHGIAIRLRVCCWGQSISTNYVLRYMAETCDINARQAVLERLAAS